MECRGWFWRGLGGSALFSWGFHRTSLHPLGAVPRQQSLQVVTVRSVAAEGFLIEQALDAAPGANLIGTSLGADRPAHLPVPAAA